MLKNELSVVLKTQCYIHKAVSPSRFSKKTLLGQMATIYLGKYGGAIIALYMWYTKQFNIVMSP